VQLVNWQIYWLSRGEMELAELFSNFEGSGEIISGVHSEMRLVYETDQARFTERTFSMGRKKKIVGVNEAEFSLMERSEKLRLFSKVNQQFHYELSRIPYHEIEVPQNAKAEQIAEEYYKEQGYEVYRSRVNGGYRSIGVEFYWQDFASRITEQDRSLIEKLKTLMTPAQFRELAYMVKEKNGTPDMLLIKENSISFVEVKFNYETVKHSTVEFYIRYGEQWPTSILRVIRK